MGTMNDDMEKAHDGLYPTMTTSKILTRRRASHTFLRQAKDASFYYKVMFSVLLFWGLSLLWREVHAAVALRRVCSQASCARKVSNVPSYVLEYAPLVWLDESESYFPSDIYAQVANTHPYVNLSIISDAPSPLTLENLDKLNSFGDDGNDVFLTSTIDVTTNPTWLNGVVPDSKGKTNGATSCAVIINDHGSGLVDAFYMYFYAYNQGNTVLSHELGDHIGDWEHNMIRFHDGKPRVMWFSQHGNGEAFTYAALEKDGIRPISYSARGSHANYAVAGNIDHTVPDFNSPIGFLLDHTSQGVLWDPTLNTYFYTYNATEKTFSSIGDEESPLGAMNFKGKWGDEQYPESDKRQPKPFFGFYKYVGGPTGPYNKQLNRTQPCPNNGIRCIIREVRGVSYDDSDEEEEEED